MSLLLPGFGQLYNGEPNRAIWLYLAFSALGVPGVAIAALYLPSGEMLLFLVAVLCSLLAVWIYAMVDAWKAARRQPDYVPRPWQTSGLYFLVLILCAAIIQPLFSSYIRNHEVESFRIPSSSMVPTLLPGDWVFADKRYNCPACKSAVQRGDVAIFTYPNDRTLYYVKRIIGLPGDHVRIEAHEILINGHSLNRGDAPGVAAQRSSQRLTEGDGPNHWEVVWSGAQHDLPYVDLTVPQGQVFVLGDNRNDSVDSRSFGPVPLQDVVGRVRQIWFSRADGAIRWNRMGEVVE